MLYVFQVDTGTMITFDMNLALNVVSNLKEAIWQNCRIPVDRQVLLVSGGECLDPGSRVCNYTAGTDTNPIFLFNKTNIDSSPTTSGQHAPSSGSLENLTEVDSVKDQIKGCLELPPTYMTVVSRAQLAQQLWEMAKDLSRRCEQLIHDQHLQHQGWAAVVANLEDVITAFRQRADNFENAFMAYLGTKDDRLATLRSFDEDVALLREIPIIPSLLPPGEAASENLSILDWIVSKDSHNLENLSAVCYKGLEKLDISVIENLQKEKKKVIDNNENGTMKEIKGLEERFYALDQLLSDAKTCVQDQYVLAQAFLNNQNSASNERDSSILPDLCQAHQHQLMVMFKKHQHLEEIRRKCAKAKEELIINLKSRLRWIMFVQHGLSETRSKLTVYSESLRRLRCQIEVVEQIHVAGQIYGEAVMEVVRRKKFSESYNKWANMVAETMDRITGQEIRRRKSFSSRFEGHFLSALFNGLEDFPPVFANMRSEPFDVNLPTIPSEEIDKLRRAYPSLPVEEDLPDFTIDVSSTSRESEESSKSAIEMENLNLKLELEKIKFESQTKDDEIKRLESIQKEEKEAFESTMQDKSKEYDSLVKAKEQEIVQVKTDLQKEIQVHSEETNTKLQEINELKEKLETTIAEQKQAFIEMQMGLEEEKLKFQEEKENELKALREQHKQDLEGLRSRYKLMASFDQRSPSDIQDKTFDSLTLDKAAPRTEELLAELAKIADTSQKSPNEGSIINQMIKGFMTKLEGSTVGIIPHSPERGGDASPAVVRARVNVSDEGQSSRVSIETEEEPTIANVKSVYGLDTSAIDATAMCISETANPISPELSDTLTPSLQITNVASSLDKAERVTIQSCSVGKRVFVYYNSRLQAYVVYLSNKSVHFLHTDCLKQLGHSADSPIEGFIAQVTERELCVAKKANNRYRVPQGFHFYRIRVEVLEIIDIHDTSLNK